MKLQSFTCPNCDAPLTEADKVGITFICPYCDTHLWADDPEASSTEAASAPAPLSIPDCCTAEDLSDFPVLRKVLKEICALLDAYQDAQSLLPEVLQSLQDKKEAATATSQEADFSKIQKKLKGVMAPDETLLLYKTTAFLSINKLRSGIFLTDKHIGGINGKTITTLPYAELHTLLLEKGLMETLWVYPNSMEQILLTLLAVTEKEFAMLLAFILLKAQEAQGSDSRIHLEMKTSS